MSAQIFIYGDSHTQALLNATKAPDFVSGDVEFDIHWMLSQKKEGKTLGDLSIEKAVEVVNTLKGDDLLVISLLGTAHNIIGLLQHSNPYRLVDEFALSNILESRFCMIPRNAMLDMFDEWCRKNKRIQKLTSNASVRSLHLMTPPPKEDNDFIESKISSYRNKSTSDFGIADPQLRLSLWELEMEALSKVCAEWHIGIVPPPPEAITERGFLKKEFYGRDATHANLLYGGLVLKQLEKLTHNAQVY